MSEVHIMHLNLYKIDFKKNIITNACMRWSKLFGIEKKCSHEHVPIDADFYYCPDCGELIENQWFLVRCASCGLKEIATIKNGEVVPANQFCHNCGAKGYIVERIEKIDCININYAVLIKQAVKNETDSYTQSWVDFTQTSNSQPKLLQ